jgi:hypothetical protein
VAITKVSNGVEFKPLLPATNPNVYFIQKVENGDKFIGKILTLSAKINGVVLACTGYVDGADKVVASSGVGDFALYFGYSVPTKTIAVNIVTASTTLTVEWVKLEVNDHASPFIPKSFAEEILLCERYFWKSYPLAVVAGTAASWSGVVKGIAINTNMLLLLNAPFATRLRTVPTVKIYHPGDGSLNYVYKIDDGAKVAVTGFSNASDRDIVQVDSSTNSFVAGKYYTLHLTCDAEL